MILTFVKENGPEKPKVGLWGQMTWRRLAEEVLLKAKEIEPHEQIVEMEVSETWIRFKVERK